MKQPNKPGPVGPGLVSFITLGCKSNQYDSAAMAAQFEAAGYARGPVDRSRVIVINTCMVTGSTEAQCRKAIRQARRANRSAKLVVAGCMSAGARDQIENMEEVDLVIEPPEKGMLLDLLDIEGSRPWTDWPGDPAVELSGRDRGFLKIQDGCDAGCTYCIVPLVRGSSRSLEPGFVLEAVRKLMNGGCGEVVLSGIHLGQYGTDLDPPCVFEDLLSLLLGEVLPGRMRLSSIEPLEITSDLVHIMASARGRICRHIHIPLQSGSDRVLKTMGRPYGSRDFSNAVRLLRDALPGIGIGCDVICGFPGESEEDFGLTCELIEELEIPFLHAFPYSPRPGTKAALLKDDVPHRVKKDRVLKLRGLAEHNRNLFAASFVGHTLETVLETRTGDTQRRYGLTDNYLKVAVMDADGSLAPGSAVNVFVEGVEDEYMIGRVAT